MSFLNPVNEPVLRFNSTDADAPQINYNSRTAGDVKAVLKACLVDGYGATASAGWSVVNEVDNVCEFVSPSAAMSDYRLGINDSSAANTTWYYQYKNVRVDPSDSIISKQFIDIDKSSASNGWDLLATSRGFLLVESVFCTVVNQVASRLTYFGRLKSALSADNGNIAFWQVGYNAPSAHTIQFFQGYSKYGKHFAISDIANIRVSGSNFEALGHVKKYNTSTNAKILSAMYLTDYDDGTVIAEQPAILFCDTSNSDQLFGLDDDVFINRPVLRLTLAQPYRGDAGRTIENARLALIYLDYWEY